MKTEDKAAVPQVYAAIQAVMKELSEEGIAKEGKNASQGYKFRGIDQAVNTLSPLLVKHGLLMIPRCLSREMHERKSSSGGALFSVTVCVEFALIAVSDGSRETFIMYGEAMDSADKATNKALSAAYKYAVFQAFCVPTAGIEDADATTHTVEYSGGKQPMPNTQENWGNGGGQGGGADEKPWLSDLQCEKMVESINAGQGELVRGKMNNYKINKKHRALLDEAFQAQAQ